jgi:hypothetical protein
MIFFFIDFRITGVGGQRIPIYRAKTGFDHRDSHRRGWFLNRAEPKIACYLSVDGKFLVTRSGGPAPGCTRRTMPPLLPVTEMRNDNLDRGVIRRGRRQSPVVVIVV